MEIKEWEEWRERFKKIYQDIGIKGFDGALGIIILMSRIGRVLSPIGNLSKSIRPSFKKIKLSVALIGFTEKQKSLIEKLVNEVEKLHFPPLGGPLRDVGFLSQMPEPTKSRIKNIDRIHGECQRAKVPEDIIQMALLINS